MEKYFIVTDQSPLHKDYTEWIDNIEKIRILANAFFLTNGIESTIYGFYGENLCIVPTENDLVKLDKVLGKDVRDKLRPFKGNSKIHKQWIKALSDINLKRESKPYAPMYFSNCSGKLTSRLFDIDDIVYCSFKNEGDIETPEGMIEIKASEFWKVIEDEEEKMLGKKDVAI